MGKLSVTAHLTDFFLPEAFDLKDLSQFNESSVKEFSVEYVDNSLVANIKTLAQKNNVPLESYLVLAKRAESNRDPANTNGDSEITSGLREFVNNPRPVKLAVTPEKEMRAANSLPVCLHVAHENSCQRLDCQQSREFRKGCQPFG